MSWQAWAALATALIVLLSLALGKARPERALLAAVAGLLLLGVVSPPAALSGFSNTGVATIALLFPLAGAIRRSGSLRRIVEAAFGAPKKLWVARLRIVFPVGLLSAFLNNTPVVALLLPEVDDWAKRRHFAPSKLLIPLSYAAILGGLCTLIGTSTNLVVAGVLTDLGYPRLGLFEMSIVGVPVALAGLIFITISFGALVPEREGTGSTAATGLAYTASFRVVPGGPLDGRQLAKIQVPGLETFTAVAIFRGGQTMPAPLASEVLVAGDVISVTASVADVLLVDAFQGLERLSGSIDASHRAFVELVISHRCPLVGHEVGDGSFRRLYGAAVVAVARQGERVSGNHGLWQLEAGDVVVVEASAAFLQSAPSNTDFYVVSRLPSQAPPGAYRSALSLFAITAAVLAAGFSVLSMFHAALAAVAFLLATRCLQWEEIREDIDWRLLAAICGAFGLGAAMQESGAASELALRIIELGGGDPLVTLILMYVTTMLVTELITNNAAAVMVLPIAIGAAAKLGVDYHAFVAVVMVAASASFLTPIGYQTNLMVYGPGNYKFTDFARAGAPLSLLVGGLTIAISYFVWLQ